MHRIKWFSRVFDFSSDQNTFPSLYERLLGTPARLEEKLKNIPFEIHSGSIDGTWSIKENIGHLTDLEPLWQGRLQDILEGKIEMRPTDLQNTQTTSANHNSVDIQHLLENFRKTRYQTIQMLDTLNEKQLFLSSLHPRLKTPMRLIDHLLFVAEHDDHHLARITELTNTFTKKS